MLMMPKRWSEDADKNIVTLQTAPLREIHPDGERYPFDKFIIAKNLQHVRKPRKIWKDQQYSLRRMSLIL